MNLKQHLEEKKSTVLKMWCDAAQVVPPDKASGFLEKQQALLVDTTGYDLAQGMECLFDALSQGVMRDDVARFLDSLIGIRAANDFKASQAVSFIMEAKKAVRDGLGRAVLDDLHLQEELSAWESAVDDLALFAFDIYVQRRENVLEFKADEARKEAFQLLRKAKLIPDDQE